MTANHVARAFGVPLLIGSFAAAFAPAVALAQQRAAGGGWYSGLSVGGSQTGIGDNVLPMTGAAASGLARDGSSTGFKLFGGYRFNQNFALEGGYTDPGKFDAKRDLAAPVAGFLSGNMRTAGFDLDAVGIIPVQNGFSLFGKIGAMYTMTRSSISTSGALLPVATFTDLNPRRLDWSPRFGMGASYDFSSGLGLRLNYERLGNVGDARTGDGNVGVWSLGLSKRY